MKQLMQKKRADAEFRQKENNRKRDKPKLSKGNTNTNTCNAAKKKNQLTTIMRQVKK